MMSIQKELDKIKNAIYGKDVRGAIHDGIKKAYDDASKEGNANMEVEMARGGYNTLNSRLNGLRVSTDTKPINVSEMDTETKQLFTGGSVAVVDIDSVGNENVKDKAITNNKTDFIFEGKNKFDPKKVNHQKGLSQTGTLYDSEDLFTSEFIKVSPNDIWTTSTSYRLAFYEDESEESYISRLDVKSEGVQASNPRTFEVPNGANYIRVTSPYETVSNVTLNNFQVEKSGYETYYEPHTDNIVSSTSIVVEKEVKGISDYTTEITKVEGTVSSLVDKDESGYTVSETILNRDSDNNVISITKKRDGKTSTHTFNKDSDGQLEKITRSVL